MVKSIPEICRKNILPRLIGFDDAPFQTRPRVHGSEIHAVGIVTSGYRFEGMLFIDRIAQDGDNAQIRIQEMLMNSKFHEQVHAVLLDGVTMGGLNVIDISYLARSIQRPVISVMRSQPNFTRMFDALNNVSNPDERIARIHAAGPVHVVRHWIFQYRCPPSVDENDALGSEPTPEEIALLLDRSTPLGTQKIPECLRIAHFVGAAIKTGQSSSSA